MFPVSDVLTTTDNDLIQMISLPREIRIWQLRATIKTAPTGAAVIVDFKKVTLATGAIGASIGTVTIAVSTFQGSTVLSAPVTLAITEGLVMQVTQIGSTIPGSNLSGFADGTK